MGYPISGSSKTAAFRKRPSMSGRLHESDYAAMVEHLTAVRKRLGVTQVELSSRLARPQSYVSKIERLERRLDLGEWRRIILALGLDPVEQFSDVSSRLSVGDGPVSANPPVAQESSLAGASNARATKSDSKRRSGS